jgi:hypothetical protein
VTALRKFTKIPRKTRARIEPRPARKPLQRVKTEGKDPAQIPRRNNDDTSVPRHHSPCQKELSNVFPLSNKRKRSKSPEERDNLISDSAQPPASTHVLSHPQPLLPTASQLPARREPEDTKWAAGRAIVVQDHDHHGVALGEHPERFTSNQTSHGETLDDLHS